jgi:hypothetical protein
MQSSFAFNWTAYFELVQFILKKTNYFIFFVNTLGRRT